MDFSIRDKDIALSKNNIKVDDEKTSAHLINRFPTDLEKISDKEWELAKNREKVIRPLVKYEKCSAKEAELTGIELGLTSRQIYNLIRRYRESGEKFLSLLKSKSRGVKGKSRLSNHQEKVVQEVIEQIFLSKQRLRVSVVIEEIRRRCSYTEIRSPSANAIRARISHPRRKWQTFNKYFTNW